MAKAPTAAEYAAWFDGSLAVEPPLDSAALPRIPARRGVFLLAAADERPILLTTAADIRARLRFRLSEPDSDARTRIADLRQITAAVYWRLAHSPFETDWQFLEIARRLWPATHTKLLAAKPPWWVAVEPEAHIPQFVRTQDILPDHRHVGPFPDRSAAEKFIEALTDAFDLCRDYAILRQAPHAQACPYKQMGRCAAPCDGSIPLERYRATVREALRFAEGQRRDHADALTARMRTAATEMAFERAAVYKARLDRLAQFDAPRYAHAGPLEAMQYVLVQSGPTSRQACALLFDRGAIESAGLLAFPPRIEQLEAVLDQCDALAAAHGPLTPADRWRMGLLTSYLFAGAGKRGLLLRRAELPDAATLGERILQAAQTLKLRAPA